MPTITTEHIVTDIKVPFLSVLNLVFKFTAASIIVSVVIGGLLLLVSFFATGALIALSPLLGM